MKKINVCALTILGFLFFSHMAIAQQQEVIYTKMSSEQREDNNMKTYLIEREIPEAGKLTKEQLKGISQKSCSVLREMGAGIEWLQSYVTDDKVYCLYKAENKDMVRRHAELGGFPVNSIQELSTTINPSTSE
ncbi:DUF4242 domain-containing protein [Flagellimonas flava]|uniref:DUF4242 domain-containing protein n=1 Tax=Flagellimonas flava TaxID=570519 RepID=A0A1M5LMN7_9FLAO|nr:DUF4242 domain-containing protein [Allomuricauda flava]SHG66337.1 Protein of unknown function [Allomuricauda flava]